MNKAKTWERYYPALGKYFNSVTAIANAACTSKTTAWRCLTGERDFNPQQKKAIAANIITRMVLHKIDSTTAEQIRAFEAYDDFDKVFKIGA